MNKLIIIGNLTRDPELHTTEGGIHVCNFSVAVNRRRSGGQTDTEYFRVTAWRALGVSCAQYLSKGRKVCVTGPVSISTYEADGKHYANLEIEAEDVEFLGGGQIER